MKTALLVLVLVVASVAYWARNAALDFAAHPLHTLGSFASEHSGLLSFLSSLLIFAL